MSLISEETLAKIAEVCRLHDEAFWHLHQFDGHAKSSDGAVSIDIRFGNVWERRGESLEPSVGVSIYSYVVASDTPSYPSFGERNHYFETVDEALAVVTEWHAKAMSYQPTAEELQEIDDFANELWNAIADKVTVIDITPEVTGNLPERFRDISNGE